VSEELDELIEMARTIRMTPEQAERQRRSFAYGNVKIENDSIPWEMIDRAAEDWKRGDRAICFLSVRAGLRCLNLVSGLYGTTEVVPFHESSRARAPAPHGECGLHLNWCKSEFLTKCCQALWRA
jgi:hypothetical protein